VPVPGDTFALLGWTIMSWGVRHIALVFLIAGVLLYGFRAELVRFRRSALMPAIRGCARGGDLLWGKAKVQGLRAVHRWHEITLFSRSDAPSRLVFGLLGVMIVLLSLRLSYQGLIPNLYGAAKSESAASSRNILTLLLGASSRHALMIVLVEAAIGFIALELFGVTGVFRFSTRYPSRWWRSLAGGFLLVVLLGFGVLEAWLSLESNEWRFDDACAEIQMDNPLCRNGVAPFSWLFPKHSQDMDNGAGGPASDAAELDVSDPAKGTIAPSGDPQKKNALYRAAISRAIEIGHTKAWLDIIFALVMPFTLMVVGLAFDFFEEMYLPAASLMFCIFHTVAAVILRLISNAAFIAVWLLGLAAKVVMLPVALLAFLALHAWDISGLRSRVKL
jgi:hypothetical protein